MQISLEQQECHQFSMERQTSKNQKLADRLLKILVSSNFVHLPLFHNPPDSLGLLDITPWLSNLKHISKEES